MSRYTCPKCGCCDFTSELIQTAGGNFSKFFDVQTKRFIAVSCSRCGYTELYRAKTDTGMNVLDFLLGG